jgi:polyhydroxyalkanoate synthesis regulator phasin
MIDTLKKTMLAGIGAAVITKGKVESALGEFVSQGKVSAADAKEIANKIARDGRAEFEQMSDQLGAKIKGIVANLNAETRERVDALEKRVQALEKSGTKRAAASKKS